MSSHYAHSNPERRLLVPVNYLNKIRPTEHASKHVTNSISSYEANCRREEDLQEFEDGLKAEELQIVRSTGLHCFRKCLSYLMRSHQIFVEVFSSCKENIVEAKGKAARMIMKDNEELLDFLIKKYLNNSSLMLELCSLELQDFIDSARKLDSCFKDVALGEKIIKMEKLKECKNKYDRSTELLVAKIRSVQEKYTETLDLLEQRVEKLNKKRELTCSLKKVVKVTFIVMMSGLFVCTVMAAAMAAPPVASAMTASPCVAGFIAGGAVAYIFSEVLKEGKDRMLAMIRWYESAVERHEKLTKLMEADTKDAIRMLEDIMIHVDKAIETGNDPLLSNLNYSVDSETKEAIMRKLVEFEKEIEELEKRRDQSHASIEKARNQVTSTYKELKSSNVWTAKIKKK